MFAGVVAALGLRTGVDAVIGERVGAHLPVGLIEGAAAAVFIAFGLLVFGILPPRALAGTLAAVAAVVLGWIARDRWVAS